MDVADRLHSAAIHLLRQVRKQDVATREAPARLSALSVLVLVGRSHWANSQRLNRLNRRR